MSYFPSDSELDKLDAIDHARYCVLVQKYDLWAYVDYLRSHLEANGLPSLNQYERMLDVEFVATHYGFLPADGRALLRLYIEWLQRIEHIERETHTQCQNLMTNTSFTRQ